MEETMTEESARRLLGFHGQRKGDMGFYNIIHIDVSRIEVAEEVLKKFQTVLEAELEKAKGSKALIDLVTEQVS
jgi:intein-encoded DNA endonuclease-like protein